MSDKEKKNRLSEVMRIMKYLVIFNADAGEYIAEVVIEVDVRNADELRGEIELRGEKISENRGIVFRCVGVEEVEEE